MALPFAGSFFVFIWLMHLMGFAVGETPQESFIEGISSYQVFPYSRNRGSIPFRVTRSGPLAVDVLEPSDWDVVVHKRWEAAAANADLVLDRVPVGGPYALRFMQADRTQMFEEILVGQIWVVGGQSNALGPPGEARKTLPEVHVLREGRWQAGADPLFEALDPLPVDQVNLSPWLQAARGFFLRTGIPVGLMGWYGGEMALDQFLDSDDFEMRHFKRFAQQHGGGAALFGWYQGESDAYHPARVSAYEERLKAMAAAMRRYSANSDMLMAIVQIGAFDSPSVEPTPYFGRIRDAQRRFCRKDQRAVLIPAMACSLRDNFRLSEKGSDRLANRVIEALVEIERSRKVVWQGPRPAWARFTDDSYRRIQVRFDNADRLIHLRGAEKDWFVTDEENRGYAEATVLRTGARAMTMQISAAVIEKTDVAADGQTLRIDLAKTGYIRPIRVFLQQKSLMLDLPRAALPGAKVSYVLLDNCVGTLLDEHEKPAAAFADLPVEEPLPPENGQPVDTDFSEE